MDHAIDTAFDARLRAAARELDEPLDVVGAYEGYLQVQRAYREQMSSDRSAEDLLGRLAELERESPDAPRGTDLVTAAVRGDPTAVGELLRQLRPMIERYCRIRVGRSGDVEDVVQDVCLAVLTALPSYRPTSTRSFREFVYRVARTTVIRTTVVPPAPDAPAPPDVDLAALDVLPRRLRDVIVLRVLAGLSPEETARALLTTPGAVRVAQHRALRMLRRNIPPQGMRRG